MRQLIMILGLSLLLVIALLAYGISNVHWFELIHGSLVLVLTIIGFVVCGVNYRTVTPIKDKEIRDTGYISLICFLTSLGASGLAIWLFSRDGKETGGFMAVILLMMIPVFFYGMVTLLAWIIALLRTRIFGV